MKAHGRLSHAAFLLGATVLMGSSFVAGKILLATIPPFLLVALRFLVAASATIPLVLLEQRRAWPRALTGIELGWVGVLGLFQTAGVMGFLFLAMRTISAPVAAILVFTNPLWVAFLSRMLFQERLQGPRVLGLAVGMVGVALTVGVLRAGTWSGMLLGLASAVSWAIATLLNRRRPRALGSWTITFWQMLIGALILLVVATFMGETWPRAITRADWVWFLWLAIPGSTVAFGLWFLALRTGDAHRTSAFLFLVPLFATVLSHWILGTDMDSLQKLGGVLIAGALWLLNRWAPEAVPSPLLE